MECPGHLLASAGSSAGVKCDVATFVNGVRRRSGERGIFEVRRQYRGVLRCGLSKGLAGLAEVQARFPSLSSFERLLNRLVNATDEDDDPTEQSLLLAAARVCRHPSDVIMSAQSHDPAKVSRLRCNAQAAMIFNMPLEEVVQRDLASLGATRSESKSILRNMHVIVPHLDDILKLGAWDQVTTAVGLFVNFVNDFFCDPENVNIADYVVAMKDRACQQSMNKWRVYEKKESSSLGVDLMEHEAFGRAVRKVVPIGDDVFFCDAEGLDEAGAQAVLQDVSRRLEPSLAKLIARQVQLIQRHRSTLLDNLDSTAADLWTPEVALAQLDASDGHCLGDAAAALASTKLEAKSYVKYAMMNSCGLLSLTTAFVESISNPSALLVDGFWIELSRWDSQSESAGTSSWPPEPFKAVVSLLTVPDPCGRCGSVDTVRTQTQVRAADEMKLYELRCRSCGHATQLK